jgi:signal transduction histidine kinase/CheY-like chemotaxis protein
MEHTKNGARSRSGAGARGRAPRLALVVGALVALSALCALTVAVVQSQSRARDAAIARFDDRGALAAQLLAGSLGQSSTRQAADAQVRLSGRVTAATLRAWEGESDPAIPYTAVYDDRGRRLAIYPAGARAAETPSGRAALREATQGRPATSDVTSSSVGPIIESFVPFPAGDGLRVLLIGFPLELTAQFASGALRDAAGTPSGGSFVLDRSGTFVTSVGRASRLPGVSSAVADAARDGRAGGHVDDTRFVVYPVSGTGLLVALAAPDDELTADLPSAVFPRLALGGFALTLLAVFLLAARALRDARRLEAARREAERANEAKSRFLLHISHELRQPLTAITGFAELTRRQSTIGEREQGWAAHIQQGGEHLLALTNELLDIARIEAGKMTLAIEPVDVRSAVGEVLSLSAPLAAERGIRLEPLARTASEQRALADPLRLKQVLMNLISNAIKYNREAGVVTVSISETSRGTVRVAVADTGEGIPPDALELLFSPFERLGAEQGPVAGTGLGLVVTKGLIEAMHGTLDVASEVGSGTTFSFELPPHAVAREEPAPARPPIASDALSGVILYIEDDQANLRFVQSVLTDFRPGLQLQTATEGEAGAALAEASPPDLLLLDLNLPDMTGEEVLRRLRARQETADVPVLILSADSTSRNVTRLLQTGADAYLTKPFDAPQFLGVVDQLLSTRL